MGKMAKIKNNPPASFMYSGNGWTEEGEGNTPADRRALGSIGPFKLAPGEELSFDFALLFYWDSTQSNFANRDSLIIKSIDIKDYYTREIASISKANYNQLNLKVYPNPARNVLNVSSRLV